MKWGFITLLMICLLSLATARAGDAIEKQISFKNPDGTTLRGTLVLPNSDPSAQFPALVLLQGSGPTNRDGNQAPLTVTNFLKQIADGLASHGIATLRFDKRGMYANLPELPKDRDRYSDFFRWENFVGDARAA